MYPLLAGELKKEVPEHKVFPAWVAIPASGGVGVHSNRYDAASTALCLNGRLLCLRAQGHGTGPCYGPTGVSPRLTLACTELAQYIGCVQWRDLGALCKPLGLLPPPPLPPTTPQAWHCAHKGRGWPDARRAGL